MKRYLITPQHFDTRSHMLEDVQADWDESVKELHIQNRDKVIAGLKVEFGERLFEEKLSNFKDLGFLPFSIIAHHNSLFYQCRCAFIHGFYYPALTATCALGERILNHLLLDLRHNFTISVHDRKSHTRNSIDDWSKAIAVLDGWRVFQNTEVKTAFEELKAIRNRSLHFNASTATSLRQDALMALKNIAAIVEKQFGFLQSRIIPGSRGAFFLQKDAESDPFIRHYYLNQCPRVSPFYMMKYVNGVWLVFDRDGENNIELSDEDFVIAFERRTAEQLTPDDIPWQPEVAVRALTPDGVKDVVCVAE